VGRLNVARYGKRVERVYGPGAVIRRRGGTPRPQRWRIGPRAVRQSL
jgi:hypothetical protein